MLPAFFYEWLVEQCNASGHRVRSCRDTWRLFLRFVARRHNRTLAQLRLADLTGLKSAPSSNPPGRSAAIPSAHVTAVWPRCAASAASWLAGNRRRPSNSPRSCAFRPRRRRYTLGPTWTRREVEAILAQPDRSNVEGQRDHALLSFLSNTGARIQESLELCPNALRWESPACGRLYGKGRKEPYTA
jgi:site-specific recombinase XerD